MSAGVSQKNDAPVIEISNLGTAFGEHVVHHDLALSVRRGEIIGVVGGSGTGKSVLMRAIIGLHKPAAGRIEVLGQTIYDAADAGPDEGFDPDAPADAASDRGGAGGGADIRSRWGVLFQGGALFSTLTVAENIQVPIKEFYPEISQTLLGEIALFKVLLSGLPEDAAIKYPAELSGGMRKRAGLARALALDPELLFLDEPTAGLDPIGAAAFDQLIHELHATLDLTVFLITHDLDTLYTICDRVAVLAEGQVIAVGTIAELVASPHPWIQEYFNGPRGRAASASQARAASAPLEQGPAASVSPENARKAMDNRLAKDT